MLGLGLPEILILLLIVVLLFGARKLPEIGRGLGSGMREFKQGVTGKDDDADHTTTPAPPQLTTPAVQSPPVQKSEETADSELFSKDVDPPRDAG